MLVFMALSNLSFKNDSNKAAIVSGSAPAAAICSAINAARPWLRSARLSTPPLWGLRRFLAGDRVGSDCAAPPAHASHTSVTSVTSVCHTPSYVPGGTAQTRETNSSSRNRGSDWCGMLTQLIRYFSGNPCSRATSRGVKKRGALLSCLRVPAASSAVSFSSPTNSQNVEWAFLYEAMIVREPRFRSTSRTSSRA